MKNQNPTPLKILVADDHEIVRAGVKLLLEKYADAHTVTEASSYQETIRLLQTEPFDILLLDLNLGDKNGMYIIREISDQFPELPIVVLSMFPENPYALQAIQEGASAYVSKTSLSNELIAAIDQAKEHKKYLNPAYLATLPLGTTLEKTEKSSIVLLSKREYEVYTMITEGLSFKEISQRLGISPKTISTYKTRILSKLSLKNTTQLIQFALQNKAGKIAESRM